MSIAALAYQRLQDVIKTRLQTYDLHHRATPDTQPLLNQPQPQTRPSSLSIARSAYQTEGAAVFFRGIGICSARAFIVNAVQWAVRTPFAGC
jgi:solute carrier family 25 carnitine/acylcarnitine transporter 20/29